MIVFESDFRGVHVLGWLRRPMSKKRAIEWMEEHSVERAPTLAALRLLQAADHASFVGRNAEQPSSATAPKRATNIEAFTPVLVAALQRAPGKVFRAAELAAMTSIPKKFVRRALTVNQDGVTGVNGVTVAKGRDGLYRFSWEEREII